MQLRLTITIAKTVSQATRLLGRGSGTALPGLIAERLDSNLARKLVGGLEHGVIIVTGTNGKTTTTKLIAEMLAASGERVLTNGAGSNLRRGILSTLIKAASLSGKLEATIGLFEVDEASVRRVAHELNPKAIVVLNLFRDQLDRYGELDTTAALIGEGIAATTAQLVLNADDPLVASLARYAHESSKVTYFGIEKLGGDKTDQSAAETVIDSDRCPKCGDKLIIDRVFYSHIGHYHCHRGHFDRPQPTISITDVSRAELSGQTFKLEIDGASVQAHLPLPGTYNLYNALAATAVAHEVGIPTDLVVSTLADTQAAFGRVEQVVINGKKLYLLLIKNPAGFTQVLETFLRGRDGAAILLAINDNHADGRDVSWLWDVPLELLAASQPVVITAGLRRSDMALRLKYAGVTSTTSESFELALRELLAATPAGGTAFVLPTYTAMLAIRNLLGKQTKLAEVWR